MKIFDWFKEFRDSYDEYQAQDSEGFIPDRGSFKCGFTACYSKLNPMFMAVQEECTRLIAEKETWCNEFNAVIILKEERERLRRVLNELADHAESWAATDMIKRARQIAAPAACDQEKKNG